MEEVCIIGAGASGLFLGTLIEGVSIIDSNAYVGAKLKVSGGGKCNITNLNISPNDYLGDSEFIRHALEGFTCKDSLEFFKSVEVGQRANGQIFGKNSSKDFIRVLEKSQKKTKFLLDEKVLEVTKEGEIFYIKTNKQLLKSKKLIVASGGVSCPVIGASDIGYKIASAFGHTIKTPSPALVGLSVQKEQFWFKELSGISFFAQASCWGRVMSGELLFSHKGISGPLVMDLSLFWEKGRVSLNFLPDLNLTGFKKSNALISTFLPLPKRFVKLFLEQIGVEDKQVSKLDICEIEKLKSIQNYEFAPAGNVGFSKAEATKGGVSTDEVDPKTFESKLVKNLYFVGEVLDVTGRLGGYNLHWAFASGKSLSHFISQRS